MDTKQAEEKALVNAVLLFSYHPHSGMFREVLNVFLSRGETYTPQLLELGEADNFKTVGFEVHELDRLSSKWDSERPQSIWMMRSDKPIQLYVTITKTSLPFQAVSINIEQDYLAKVPRVDEFLGIVRDLYTIVHPAYGSIEVPEMTRTFDHPLGRATPSVNLRRALPDVFWANFLGPEYIEMFGQEKINSCPCHSVGSLPDGGALLILSQSPLDYLRDPTGFDRLRSDIKKHLGEDAFDTGWPRRQGRVPKFRYSEELQQKRVPQLAPMKADLLSSIGRSGWEKWMEDNEHLALQFVADMAKRGLSIDFSSESLGKLDEYFGKESEPPGVPKLEFLMKLAAYVSQIIIRLENAKWSFGQSDDIPSLMIDTVQITPLARALKVFEEGEKLEPWYRFIVQQLIPAVESSGVVSRYPKPGH